MSQIEELQGRIASALDRISQGLDAQSVAQADPAEMDALREALDEERSAVQQLEERNRVLNERISALETKVEELSAQDGSTGEGALADAMEAVGTSIAQVRKANTNVRNNNQKLREANASNSSEPHLINSGMMAELDSLKSMRELDQAELTAILEALEAVLGPDTAAQGGV